MNKYKINYIYSGNSNINDVFIKVLNKEIERYTLMICKNKKYERSYII